MGPTEKNEVKAPTIVFWLPQKAFPGGFKDYFWGFNIKPVCCVFFRNLLGHTVVVFGVHVTTEPGDCPEHAACCGPLFNLAVCKFTHVTLASRRCRIVTVGEAAVSLTVTHS